MTEPRIQHYQFAHRVLPSLAERIGARLVTDEPPPGYTAVLKSLWDNVGERLAPEDRLPNDGIAGHRVVTDDLHLLLVELPPPSAAAEAHFVALVQRANSDELQVFTLERAAFPPMEHSAATILGAWSDGGHVNLGPGPRPDRTAFVAAIQNALTRS